MPRMYRGEDNQLVAFPMGGIGAGTICLEGTGALSHVSLYHRPDLLHEPNAFAALTIRRPQGNRAVVLQGPVPERKIFRAPGGGHGLHGRNFGLPRFREASFTSRFPFGTVTLRDDALPVTACITGWSPFEPGDSRSASLPLAALEYRIANAGSTPLDLLFSFHTINFIGPADRKGGRGFVRRDGSALELYYQPPEEKPFDEGWCRITLQDESPAVDCRWFRGFMFDGMTEVWNRIEAGEAVDTPPYPEEDARQSMGGSLYLPLTLGPGESRTLRLLLSWYVPRSSLREGEDPLDADGNSIYKDHMETYTPYYATLFDGIGPLSRYWAAEYESLRTASARFADTLYRTTLDEAVLDAVAANLSILKSPTVMRQADGRFWSWEGSGDRQGSCHGSCTHVLNYAQALCHLFPDLERSLRDTEFHECQDERGDQRFRAPLPIRVPAHQHHPAADGQLGGILKVYRDYHIGADRDWLAGLWPRMKQSLDYCIGLWDRECSGVLRYPHHNTYDIEFWGPDGMNQSIYAAALRAMAELAEELGEPAGEYRRLYAQAKAYLEQELFDGEYFIQKVQFRELGEDFEAVRFRLSEESRALLEREGPHYQYGTGCLSDGIIGDWMGFVCGLPGSVDDALVRRHLLSVFRYNFRTSLRDHADPQRPGYALGEESGLLNCTWPHGGRPSLPFIYSNEVWTGVEYQVAAHLISKGYVEQGLAIVRSTRSRYNGRARNPYNEYECGHWYQRALASYSLLQACTGIRYDAVTGILAIEPRIEGDFTSFLSTAFGYGVAGVKNGEPFVEWVSGSPEVRAIRYTPYTAVERG